MLVCMKSFHAHKHVTDRQKDRTAVTSSGLFSYLLYFIGLYYKFACGIVLSYTCTLL